MKSFLAIASLLALTGASPLLQDRENTCVQGSKPPYGALTHSACPCWSWYKIQIGDGDCGKVAAKFGVSREDIIKWNPDVSVTVDGTFYDCINFWPQQQICVGVTAPNPLPTPPCNADPPYPVGQGTVCGCKRWYQIQRGDDCGPVAAKFGISEDQLIKWNPWLSADVDGTHYACMNMWPTDNLCVGNVKNIMIPPFSTRALDRDRKKVAEHPASRIPMGAQPMDLKARHVMLTSLAPSAASSEEPALEDLAELVLGGDGGDADAGAAAISARTVEPRSRASSTIMVSWPVARSRK